MAFRRATLRENEFGSFYWLLEDDGSPKGKFIRTLARKEAEEIKSAKGRLKRDMKEAAYGDVLKFFEENEPPGL